jgi:hypothetical protein
MILQNIKVPEHLTTKEAWEAGVEKNTGLSADVTIPH